MEDKIQYLKSLLKEYHDEENCVRNLNYISGYGYIQVDVEKFEKDKEILCECAKKHYPSYEDHFNHRPVNQHSFIGRLLDGGYNEETVLYSDIWAFFSRTDDKGRRWGQPYYSITPREPGVYECYNKYIRDIKIGKILLNNERE